MKRKLPTYNLRGTTFSVDVDNRKLIEASDNKNKIDFLDMIDYGTHYELQYHPEAKNRVTMFNDNHEQYELIKVPQMTALDPIGMSIKHNLPVAQVYGRMDVSFIVDHELLKKRLAGILPAIYLAGDRFNIEYNQRQLICEIGRSVIHLDQQQNDRKTEGYIIYYHKHSGEAVYTDLDHKLSPDVIPLIVPNLFDLDPVAGSREHYNSDVMLLRSYPLQMERHAEALSKEDLKQQLNWITEQNNPGYFNTAKINLNTKREKSTKKRRVKSRIAG